MKHPLKSKLSPVFWLVAALFISVTTSLYSKENMAHNPAKQLNPKQEVDSAVCLPPSIKPPHLDLSGHLMTGMMAIGGETTGLQLKTDDGSIYELAVADKGQQSLLEKIKSDAGVRVSGWHVIIPGVEVKQRSIIIVEKLEPAASTGKVRP